MMWSELGLANGLTFPMETTMRHADNAGVDGSASGSLAGHPAISGWLADQDSPARKNS